jgi:NADH-quinone oxidoreductase subunit C
MLPESLRESEDASALARWSMAALLGGKLEFGEVTLEIEPGEIVAVCRFLKTERGFARLSAVMAVDRYPAEPRFEIVYLLHSLDRNKRLRVKCRVGGERPEVDSVCGVWGGADWYEREVFDMFGVAFRNHPDLRRILMPEDWEGHPLRKDYPVTGDKYAYGRER